MRTICPIPLWGEVGKQGVLWSPLQQNWLMPPFKAVLAEQSKLQAPPARLQLSWTTCPGQGKLPAALPASVEVPVVSGRLMFRVACLAAWVPPGGQSLESA